jgi:hypothetical protein
MWKGIIGQSLKLVEKALPCSFAFHGIDIEVI